MSRVAQKIALDLLHAAAPTGVSTPTGGMPRRRRSSRSRTTPTPLPAGGGLAAGVAKEAQLTEASLPNGHSARRRSSPKIAGTASPESSSPGSSDAQDVLVDALGNSSRSRKPHKSEPTPADVPDWAFIPRGDFPRDEREREVLDRLLRAHAASTRRRSLGFREELPYDMLYGCAAPPRAPSLRPPAAPARRTAAEPAAPRSSLQLCPRRRAQGGEARHAAPRPTPHAAHLVVVVGRRVGEGGVHVPAGGPPPTR